MFETSAQEALEVRLSTLVETAVGKGVPAHIAREARHATRRAVGSSATESSARVSRRAEGYFWAVVRRKLVRHKGPSDATARFVLAAVVEDLLGSGRDSGDVWLELERGWADKVPRGVLEEFRLRMCA